MLVNCMMCRKEFDISHDDPQYQKLIQKQTKYYICSLCNFKSKHEAIASSGINPEILDRKGYDKLVP